MPVKIAFLGWGSLLWEGGKEFDRWHEPWSNDGPSLKIEFSRISHSRSGALTLVIDHEHGNEVCVAWCLSKRQSMHEAACDIHTREGTTLANIAQLVITPQVIKRDSEDPIISWARTKQLSCVVWTALSSNFEKKRGQPFSVSAATSYLKSLGPASQAKAIEYIRRAPTFVKTNLRTSLQSDPWFSEEDS